MTRINMLQSAKGAILPLTAVAAWEAAARAGWYDPVLLPGPSAIALAWKQLLVEGVLIQAVAASLVRVFVGVGMAGAIAIPLAILVCTFEWLDRLTRPFLELLRPISPLAWTPLAIFWFKIGDRPAYFIVFVGAFFPIFLNSVLGIRSVSQLHLDVAKSFHANLRLTVTDVIWPAAKPSIISGCRIGLGVGWMSLIAAELIGVRTGLGYLIQLNRVSLRMDNVIAVMLTIGCIGLIMNYGISVYSRWSMPWQREELSRI